MNLSVEPGAARPGDKVEVGCRPENLHLGDGLKVRVRVLERLGGVAIAYGVMADGVKICTSLSGDAAIREGEDISLTIASADAHVFDVNGNVMRRRNAPALVN
jgi:multiple sugar transport system ATP-binding protein